MRARAGTRNGSPGHTSTFGPDRGDLRPDVTLRGSAARKEREIMSDKVKRILIPIAITLAVAGIAYGVGRLQGHLHVKEVQGEAEETATALEGQVAEVRQELTTCTQRADKLEARRRLHMALEELNALNFGYAQRHLQSAGRTLAGAAPDDAELQTLATTLEEMQVAPSGQLEQQRQQVRKLIEQLDAAAPPAQQ
jgi:DNA repair exonuclease SbcCD ATPase subunit